MATPTDKPIVERDVQTIREEFRKELARNPSITITELNQKIKDWIISIYGQRCHGTTKEKPYEIYQSVELPALGKLPEEAFEAAQSGKKPRCIRITLYK